MEKLLFDLVSPEKHLLTEKVDMAVLPGEGGDFGVLYNHSALISNLRPGLITIYNDDKVFHHIFISRGFANVNERGCTVLAEDCIFVEDLAEKDLQIFIQKTQDEIALARSEDERHSLKKDLELAMIKRTIVKHLMKKPH